MDGKKLAIICAIGILGTAFIGYCIYFDRKRRNHPDYKRNVLKRRKSTMKQNSKTVDLNDPKAREQFLASEFDLANQSLVEGNIEEAVAHYINFIQFSPNPKMALATLQQILPPAIFNAIINTFAAIAKAKGQQSSDEIKITEDVD